MVCLSANIGRCLVLMSDGWRLMLPATVWLFYIIRLATAADTEHQHDMGVPSSPDTTQQLPDASNSENIGGHSLSYLHFEATATILFQGWTTQSWSALIAACFGVAAVSAIYEFLQMAVGRLQLVTSAAETITSSHTATTPSSASSLTLSDVSSKKPSFRITRRIVVLLLLQTLLHVFRVALGYALMLVVMSFNASIYLAVLIGAALGHLAAAWTDLCCQTAELCGTGGGDELVAGTKPRPFKTNYQTCH